MFLENGLWTLPLMERTGSHGFRVTIKRLIVFRGGRDMNITELARFKLGT